MTIVADAFEVDGAIGFGASGVVVGRSETGPWSDFQDAAMDSIVLYNRKLYQLVGTPASSSSSWKDLTNPAHGVETFFEKGINIATLGSGTIVYPQSGTVSQLHVTTSTSNAVVQLPTISAGLNVGDALALTFEIDSAVDMSTIPVVVRAATGEYIRSTADTELQLDTRLVSIGLFVKSNSSTYLWELF